MLPRNRILTLACLSLIAIITGCSSDTRVKEKLVAVKFDGNNYKVIFTRLEDFETNYPELISLNIGRKILNTKLGSVWEVTYEEQEEGLKVIEANFLEMHNKLKVCSDFPQRDYRFYKKCN